MFLFLASSAILLIMSSLFFFQTRSVINKRVNEDLVNELEMISLVIDEKIEQLDNITEYIANNQEIQSILKKEEYESYNERFLDMQKLYIHINSVEIRSKDIPIYIMSVKNPLTNYTNQDNFPSIYGNYNGYPFKKITAGLSEITEHGYYVHRRVDGKEGKDIVLTIIRRISDINTGEHLGYIFLDVYDEFFDGIFQSNILGDKSNIYLVNNHNDTIVTDRNNKTETGFDNRYTDIYTETVKDAPYKKLGKDAIYEQSLKKSNFSIVEVVPIKTLYRERIFIMKIVGLTFVASIFVSGAIAYIISKSIYKPIEEIISTMKEVEDGNFSVRVDVKTGDEMEYLGEALNKMVIATDDLINQVYAKEVLLKEGEIKLLKSKMNPHFINNTLESIKWLMRSGEVKKASEMITPLGKIISDSIDEDEFVRIQDDYNFLKHYIKIQKFRFEDRLEFSVNIDESVLEYQIPSLLLQPIVENSIVHGIERLKEGGIVDLDITENDGYVIIKISNNGPEISNVKTGHGFALYNIQRRLKLYYGDNHQYKFERVNGITVTEIVIPIDQGDVSDV